MNRFVALLSPLLAPPTNADEEALARAVEGKTVVVTGASFGIGRALAIRLGRSGAIVLLMARSEEKLEQVREQVLEGGGRAHVYPVDLRDSESVDRAARAILAEHQQVDIVVHNAGKSIRRSLHHSLDRPHDFERCMGVNYLGPVRLQLALTPSMLERGGGQIVNVSSVSVRLSPAAYWAAYHSSKSAFDLWLGAAAPELLPAGIRCTSVYFGLVHTRMSAPTESYASMPGQSPDQAATVLCRAIIERPRVLQPWWLGPARWLCVPFERVSEWVQSKILRGPKKP